MSKVETIVAVGQTPPPYGGQTIMIELMLRGHYDGIVLDHVRMGFSQDFDEAGKLKLHKLTHLFTVVGDIYAKKFKTGARVLYYPPSHARMFPVLRDIFILISTRWLFKKIIFHFHSSGLSEIKPRLPLPVRLLYNLAYGKPDISIRLSPSAPDEGAKLGSKREYIVANGIEDAAKHEITRIKHPGEPTNILFVGLLVEDKGILVMLDAFCKVRVAGWNVRLTCMGKWSDADIESRSRAILAAHDCTAYVEFPGVLIANAKWLRFEQADIFCFPTFFLSETFPTVLLEAMSYSLPIVSTNWRGIPDVVDEGGNAILVNIEDSQSCADALCKLLSDDELRLKMAHASRTRFVENFTVEVHWSKLERIFREATGLESEVKAL